MAPLACRLSRVRRKEGMTVGESSARKYSCEAARSARANQGERRVTYSGDTYPEA